MSYSDSNGCYYQQPEIRDQRDRQLDDELVDAGDDDVYGEDECWDLDDDNDGLDDDDELEEDDSYE